MKLVIHDYAGHAFTVQLSRELAKQGHEVHHLYCGSVVAPQGSLTPQPGDADTFSIEGISLAEQITKQNFLRRRFQEVAYGKLLAERVAEIAPDAILSANTPTEIQALLLRTCKTNSIRFVSWVQDFYGLAVHKLLRKRLPILGELIGIYYRWLDRWVLRNSDHVVLITEDFRPLTERMGIPTNRTTVIENWAPLDDLPMRPKDNQWARKHDLHDKFVFLYSGTLGMKHNPELLLELAKHFRDDPEVRVVVVTEGIGGDWLREKKQELKLGNLVLLSYQPFGDFPEVLGSADVLVAILEPDAGVFSVPSKVLSYFCAGKPLLAAIPAENLAARIISRIQAGLVEPPEEPTYFTAGAARLLRDSQKRSVLGQNARLHSERAYDIRNIAARMEGIVSSGTTH